MLHQKKKPIIDVLYSLRNKTFKLIYLYIIFGLSFYGKAQIHSRTLHECKNITIAEISELKEFTHHCYNVKAFVSSVYTCPPCPVGRLCKPCAPNSLFLVDRLQKKSNDKVLTLFIDAGNPEKLFPLNSKGIFSFLAEPYRNKGYNKQQLLTSYYRLLGYTKH